VALPENDALGYTATVRHKKLLGPHHCIITLQCEHTDTWLAGQYVNLRHPDGFVRSYSIASASASEDVELHVMRMQNGSMSNWLHDALKAGDSIEIQGPHGECIYLGEEPDSSLLMIGTGTGLAPLLGVARDAINANHAGDIHLYHGSREPGGLYLHDTLLEMQQQYDNFHYHPCLSGTSKMAGVRQGRANEVALADFACLQDINLYLCGHVDMVKAAKRDAYLQGADLAMIHADPFVHAELRKHQR
jgi:NAD(P)H-flavin reductase